ncbi:hypothetical protein K502DRAFT_332339 [Neoconidiobolus thromboides FSU 785]|nr:hypothetical protein K502DRAFT_332339 [Neoconidiobolus thromboides FSU 785]
MRSLRLKLDESGKFGFDEVTRQKGWELLERIEMEVSLYQEFVKGGKDLILDTILNAEEAFDIDIEYQEDLDSNYSQSIKGILSPLSPTMTTMTYTRDDMTNYSMNENENLIIQSLLELNKELMLDNEEDSMIQWIQLTHITKQLFNEQTIESLGRPLLFYVNKWIVFATSKGLLVVFDFHQKLKFVLGNTAVALEHGSITSLDISKDGDWLLVGYSQGLIAIWDLIKGQIITTILPILEKKKSLLSIKKLGHIKGNQIRNVQFLGKSKRFLSADEMGNVFYHHISTGIMGMSSKSKLIYINKSKSKSIEDVLVDMQTLSYTGLNKSMEDMNLVAILSYKEVIVMRLKPKTEIIYTITKKEIINSLKFKYNLTDMELENNNNQLNAMIKFYSSSKVDGILHDPLLAVSFNNVLIILKVSLNNENNNNNLIDIIKLNEIHCDYSILSLNWINHRNLLILDQREILHLLDIQNKNNSTTIGSLSQYQPILNYPKKEFNLTNSNNNNNNNDQHYYEIIPDYKYGLTSYKNKLFLLGNLNFTIGLPLSWSDHVMNLINKGEAIEAILLASHYLKEGSIYYFSMLSENINLRKKIMKNKISALLLASLNHLTLKWGSNRQEGKDYLLEVDAFCKAVVQACFELGELDLLFINIYEKLKLMNLNLYLYLAIEPYVMFPTPIIIDFLEELPMDFIKEWLICYSKEKNYISRIESILFHLNPLKLDLDLCTKICKQYQLLDGLLFLYSTAMLDFITPIKELLVQLEVQQQQNNSNNSNKFNLEIIMNEELNNNIQLNQNQLQFNKLLDYLIIITKGKSFPTLLPLSPQSHELAVQQISKWILSQNKMCWGDDKEIKLPKVDGLCKEEESVEYPYFKFLCWLDSKGLLDILNNLEQSVNNLELKFNVNLFQELTNPFLQCLWENEKIQLIGKNRYKLMEFFIKLAVNQKIKLEFNILDKIFMELTNINDRDFNITFIERQQVMLNLIKIYQPRDKEILLNASFFKVLKWVYEKEEDYKNMFLVCLLDKELFKDIFEILIKAYALLKDEKWKEFKYQIELNFIQLTKIDPKQTKNIIQLWYKDNEFEVIPLLDKEPELQYNYLKELVNEEYEFNNELKLNYLNLLCQFNSNQVINYLKFNCNEKIINEMMEIVKKYKIINGIVYLLELQGKLMEAMEEILKVIKLSFESIEILLKSNREKQDTLKVEKQSKFEIKNKTESELMKIQTMTAIGMGLCDRSQVNLLNDNNMELSLELNYQLISCLLMANQKIYETQEITEFEKQMKEECKLIIQQLIQDLFTIIINPSMGNNNNNNNNNKINTKLSVPKLLTKLLESIPKNETLSNSTSNAILNEFQDLLISVINTCSNEKKMLQITKQIVAKDCFKVLKLEFKNRVKGLRAFAPRCVKCGFKVTVERRGEQEDGNEDREKVIVFPCGHLSHVKCIEEGKCKRCAKY